jgi:hypothetical protein
MAAELVAPAPSRARVRSFLLRVALALFAVISLAIGVIGWLHTATGRVAYARVFGASCPVGRASAQDVERGRVHVARAVRGTTRAAERPALGFVLDRTTRAEVDQWASRNGVECRERRERTLLLCGVTSASAVGREGPSFDEVTFAFTPGALRLVNLTAVRYRLSPDEAVRHVTTLEARMRASVGAPSRRAGELDAQHLGSGPYATSAIYYAFSDYVADVTATNIPTQGVLVREHFMSAVD